MTNGQAKRARAAARGKKFEEDFRNSFLGLTNIVCERLNDQEGHRRGVNAPCDFILFEYPTLAYCELKSTRQARLELARISDNQWSGLISRSRIPGVVAGVLIEFRSSDEFPEVRFFPIHFLEVWKAGGHKSIGLKEGTSVPLSGWKRRTRWRYDIQPWMERIRDYACSVDRAGEDEDIH